MTSDKEQIQKITRIGVYGVAIKEGQMLLVTQKKGPYKDKLDFPGGKIEFGEAPEQTLRRELLEEVAMKFDSIHLIDNLTVTVNVPFTPFHHAYSFFHVGMIYQLNGCYSVDHQTTQELHHIWIDPKTLSKNQCSNLLWEYKCNSYEFCRHN